MRSGNQLLFAKSKEGAKIPTKEDENAGYDIYACFDEDYTVILPHSTVMIPTGLHSACDEDYYIQLQERGSTGTKGIAQRCGVIDSNYRGEWFVPITNTHTIPLVISKLCRNELHSKGINGHIILYPYEKAICQAVVLPVPKMRVSEVPLDELKAIKSNRGDGCLGSTSK